MEVINRPLPEGFELCAMGMAIMISDLESMSEGCVTLAGFESLEDAKAFVTNLPKFVNARPQRTGGYISGIGPQPTHRVFWHSSDHVPNQFGHSFDVIVRADRSRTKYGVEDKRTGHKNDAGARRFRAFAKAVSEWSRSKGIA